MTPRLRETSLWRMASGLHLARLRCTGCGECCRGLRVPLTFADLERLREASAQS